MNRTTFGLAAGLAAGLVALAPLAPAAAQTVAAEAFAAPEGWAQRETAHPYPVLLERLRDAVKAENMAVVTDAGPTEAAASRGVEIPGNRVVGVFRNDYAVRALEASVPAMIEAPIRFYVTETADGAAMLSWKTPSHVFAPYMDEAGPGLGEVGRELDDVFDRIADRAAAPE